jgi:anti-sigma factor RsiW
VRLGRPRGHDPERAAAEYVSGDLRRRARLRFERHILECEDCWREVRVGRAGRRFAETGRELAPSSLRDAVRAAVALSGEGMHGRRRRVPLLVLVLGLVAAITGGALVLSAERQPGPIAEAVSAYRAGTPLLPEPPTVPAPDLSSEGFELAASGGADLDGLESEAFVYRGRRGERLYLFLSRSAFPVARDATANAGTAHGWVATDDGVAMVCADDPVSHLLLGDDARRLEQLEAAVRRALPDPAALVAAVTWRPG